MDLVSGGTIKPTPLPPPEPKSANVFSGLKKTDKARPGTRKLSDANRKWIVDDATTGKGHWAALDPATGKMEAQRVIEGKYGRLSLSGAYHDLHVLNNAQALLDQHWKPGMPYELAHGWGGIHDSDMPFYHPEYRVYEAKQKHIKVKDFITNVLPHLDAALQADYLKSDAAAIALLMRKTSLRSGSTPMGSGKVETYGAASLRRSHVHMDEVRRPMTATEMLARSPEEVRAGVHHSPDWIPDPGIASIDFVGKKGVHQYFEYDDPMLYKLFQHYLKKNKNYTFTHQRKELDEKGNVAKTTTHKLDRLFANEGVRQRGGRQRDAYGDMVHWFRTRGAAGKTATAPYGHIPYAMRTAAATILAQKVKADLYSDKPTSEREFKNRRKLIAQHVCRLLGNKPTESDKTYIAPEVYADWTKGQSWEIPEDEGVEEVSNAD
jgi:hypothetical protein